MIKLLTKTAKMPTRATQYAAGLDLYADESCVIAHHTRRWVSTGIAVAIDPYMVGQVWPRSGKAGKGMDTSAGVIDADYRGELQVLLVNESDDDLAIHAEDRIAQLLIVPVAHPTLIEVDELPVTDRGVNGFGHSGE